MNKSSNANYGNNTRINYTDSSESNDPELKIESSMQQHIAPNATNTEINEETKLADILQSIRGMIDNHNIRNYDTYDSNPEEERSPKHKVTTPNSASPSNHTNNNHFDNAVLELTDVIQGPQNTLNEHSLIAHEIQKQTEEEISKFINYLSNVTHQKHHQQNLSPSMEIMLGRIINPLAQEWIENNLSKLAASLVKKEIDQIMNRANNE